MCLNHTVSILFLRLTQIPTILYDYNRSEVFICIWRKRTSFQLSYPEICEEAVRN